MNIIVQLKTKKKTEKENVITQYIEINMYNIHAHIERNEKCSNGKEEKKRHLHRRTNLILFYQIPLTIHTNI
jgi:hypothetical protein